MVGTSSGLSLIGLLHDLSNFPKGPPGFVCCVYIGDEILPSFTGDYELHKPSQGYISKNQPENSNGKSPLGPRFFFPKRLHLWRFPPTGDRSTTVKPRGGAVGFFRCSMWLPATSWWVYPKAMPWPRWLGVDVPERCRRGRDGSSGWITLGWNEVIAPENGWFRRGFSFPFGSLENSGDMLVSGWVMVNGSMGWLVITYL